MSIFEVLNKGRRATWYTSSSLIALLTIIIGTVLSAYFHISFFKKFSTIALMAASITGLTFTLALLMALNSVFSDEELKRYYKHYTDHSSEKLDNKFTFFETFAPYIWIALLFSTSAVISLIGGVIDFTKIIGVLSVNAIFIIREFFKILEVVSLGLGIFSLLDLLIDTVLNKVDHIVLTTEE